MAVVWGDDACSGCGDLVDTDIAGEWGQLCAALASHGHVVTTHPRPAGIGPTLPKSAAEVLPFVGEWAGQLDQLWSSEPPDVVHAFGWLGGLAAQLAARRHQRPIVQSFHGLAATMGPGAGVERTRLEPLLIRNASWVTGGSDTELDALTRIRRSRAQLSVFSVGVDVDRYAPAGPRPADGTHRVLQLGPNISAHNGFHRTIGILPRIPHTELVIAERHAPGGDRERNLAALKRLATELGVGERVHFTGTVAAEEIPALLRSTDVVACTPQHAPRATTALEAMASGVVVVAVAVDALIDTVVNGVTGLLVSPTKPIELANSLKSLQKQRFQRESMGSAGRSRVLSRFTWDRIALDALNIYHQASSQRASARSASHARSALA
ncbi:hypothetical protein A5634_14775 [Mycobacterium asiaticum]|uniref:Glycosyl transferase family 1 n=1 Tax=Mycobacterium asiaticum TaxID=1790 RepID=A0A1A3PA65_MYCAS|nr:hypothetical protein A5634_14775 [Mycobacterium asiaticum]